MSKGKERKLSRSDFEKGVHSLMDQSRHGTLALPHLKQIFGKSYEGNIRKTVRQLIRRGSLVELGYGANRPKNVGPETKPFHILLITNPMNAERAGQWYETTTFKAKEAYAEEILSKSPGSKTVVEEAVEAGRKAGEDKLQEEQQKIERDMSEVQGDEPAGGSEEPAEIGEPGSEERRRAIQENAPGGGPGSK